MNLAPVVQQTVAQLVMDSIGQVDVYAGDVKLGSLGQVAEASGEPTDYLALTPEGEPVGRGTAGGPQSDAELKLNKRVVQKGALLTLTGWTATMRGD